MYSVLTILKSIGLIIIGGAVLMFQSLWNPGLKVIQDANLRAKPSIDSAVLMVIPMGYYSNTKVVSTDNESWLMISSSKDFPEGSYIHSSLASYRTTEHPIIRVITVFILFCLIRFIVIKIIKSRCPKCKKFFVARFLRREEISDKCTGMSYDQVQEVSADERGNNRRITYRKVPVNNHIITYRNYHQCGHCHHKWCSLSYKSYKTY